MLIPSQYSQRGTFERVLRSKDGQLMRVCFEVYEVNGEIKGRIINAEPIFSIERSGSENFAQSIYAISGSTKIISPYSWIIEKKITSPFSEFEFLTSIKIRAPSF